MTHRVLRKGLRVNGTIDIRKWPPVKQVALRLRKHPRTIRRMAKDGRLKGVIYAGGDERPRMKIDPLSVETYQRTEHSDEQHPQNSIGRGGLG